MKIYFQKLLSILCVIVLFASLAVPAFAEDAIEVEEGYNIDCVPYSPYISSLIVTDNEEEEAVYYSSSKARTYSATASTFSVSATSATSDTSTDSLYYFHDMWDIWSYYAVVPNHTTGAISKVTDSNGYDGLQFVSVDYQKYPTFRTPEKVLSSLKSGNKYSFSYTLNIPYANWGEFSFYLFDSADSTKQIVLAQKAYSTNIAFNKTITATVIIPDDWSGQPCLRFVADRLENPNVHFTLYINDLTITDITNENLDKSLDKFGDRLENAGSDEPALDTDISAFQSAIDTMNGWLDQLDEFADSIDAAGQTANEYISKGTEIFNGFMSVAPAAVIALVAFGVVFIVVRKIVGR